MVWVWQRLSINVRGLKIESKASELLTDSPGPPRLFLTCLILQFNIWMITSVFSKQENINQFEGHPRAADVASKVQLQSAEP